MGANQSLEANLWSSTFQLQSKNSKLGLIKLTDKQTEDCYVCRKISTIDKNQMQQMDRLIDLKLSIQSPYITKLQRAETQQNRQYCAYGKNYFLLFKQPYQTLKQQTLNRKFKNATYTQAQIQLMLQIGVKALSFLKNIDHPHQNISSSSFFVNQNRSIILGDPFMFPKQNIPVTTRNGFIYPSPEMIKLQHNQIDSYNSHLSDLFTFGLVLLEVYFMENMDCVYQRYFERVDHDIVLKRISQFKSEQLRKKMFILLDPESKNRQIIYKYFVNSISSTDIFNRMPKDKFKKNIDRYNLATSQVTQWKNQLPLEPRLNSSEGKKSFSVSTTDHFLTQEKGFQYYERQYGTKVQPRANSSSQLYPPSQNQPKFINLNQRSHKNFNRNESANEPKFNASTSRTIHGQSISNPRYIDPTYNQNSWQNLPSYSNGVTNPHLINKPTIIDMSKRAEISSTQSNFRLYPLNTDFNFTKSYQVPSLDQNMPLVEANNHNFNFHSSNPTQTFSPSYTQNYKYSQNQNFTFFQPKYETSLSQYKPFSIQNSVDISRQYTSSYVPSIIQTQKPNDGQSKPINYPTFSKQPEIYQLSITTQPKPEILFKATQSIQLPITTTQPKTTTLSVEQQKKPEQLKPQQKKQSTTTPSKQRKRRHPSYGNLHHLSTINQRSQLTESMTSDISDRKSQILIEEDVQNNQQGQNKSSQNILPQLEKSLSGQNSESSEDNTSNKVWSIVYPSGTKYVGQIGNQKRNGLGTFYYIDGSKYHGNWLNNKMNGYGTLYYPTGKIAYQGQWKLDNFHGKGKVHNDEIPTFEGLYHYQNCQDIDNYWLQYQGELFQDRREGQGILRLANGQYFQGIFVNDQLNGLCKFYTKENIVIEGIWERNKMVRKIQEKQLTEEILKG